jgi:hypothetical protein
MSARKYSDDGESKARETVVPRVFWSFAGFVLENTILSHPILFPVSKGHAGNTKDRWMSHGLFQMVSTISAYCTEQDGEQERADR